MNLKYFGAALFGGLVGAGVTLLAAPASGAETRRRISRRAREERDALARKGRRSLRRAAERLEDGIGQARRSLDRVIAR